MEGPTDSDPQWFHLSSGDTNLALFKLTVPSRDAAPEPAWIYLRQVVTIYSVIIFTVIGHNRKSVTLMFLMTPDNKTSGSGIAFRIDHADSR